ncbi:MULTISPECIES: phosphoadenosine phosphosulfate reductase family protein [Oscillospiraceae]|uniref:Phosphoadenosine phosphosulfate reductase n=1 Tax=Pseudobacteroides cellulosolvens ATCC 35603 = DSM 2933 TaxID=398512 RepID=A0A0L6JTK6_9FIRM|nr:MULTISPECIES: phosphoadenosine phosphosulfate reductase family protein [Oscillospiraceae]KNY29054.1 phosphoadenosine phosphosulfate reductase [Pseudobacteroides cellulosolvens ATCC 35603 = DSM 2933]
MGNRHELWELRQMQSLPLEVKIEKSRLRIREFYEHFNGKVTVSFSGGKDSTVLLHLVRSIYPEVGAVFSDTGLEFIEIKEFVKTIENVTWVRPDMSFRQVIEKYGYPVVSKEQADLIERVRNGATGKKIRQALTGLNEDGSPTKYKISEQWKYLLSAPFKISCQCCKITKKMPMDSFYKESGTFPYIGTMACESMLRQTSWLQTGCNVFDGNKISSKPLSFWMEDDIWKYINIFDVPYCKIYKPEFGGYLRTGCVFCMFGVHLEEQPNRFQKLQKTHPKLWRYCMRDWEDGGLGLRQVLDYMGVPYENYML